MPSTEVRCDISNITIVCKNVYDEDVGHDHVGEKLVLMHF